MFIFSLHRNFIFFQQRAQGDASKWDNQCSVCKLDGDELLMCEYFGCRKVYHFKCVGLSKMPRGVYHCPCHDENRKVSKPKKQVCCRNKMQMRNTVHIDIKFIC